MSRLSNAYNFLAYMSMPLGEEEIFLLYKANNVIYERALLYNDFLESLFTLINKTYLGPEFITEEDEKNHFNWCLTKIVEDFKKENICFKITREFKTYTFDYVKDIFYEKEDKEIYGDKMIKFWIHIFKYDGVKTKSDLDAFIDMYKILEICLMSQ
jgi:hypothetical protein